MKNKIIIIMVILMIIVGIRGLFELIREEPISTKVETVTILDTHRSSGKGESNRVKMNTHDGWIHTINTDRDTYEYCTDNIGKDINLTIQRSRLVHFMKDKEILTVVGY
jgi:hypothetical protein